ncbi:acyltransferase family protein [Gilvimarinus polysaccharolyticus]|uniref:acyltransferase family protein n=1 Tax=Gilvimarinus polysaccharolyticus TaxID=863921 RepID=UPI000673371B|nr:heparan-alpha-glucosaminide N-acetyltransferase domain-containing protein [Gilvimarinus polysaccharolyticus]
MAKQRFISLDVMRGLTLALMVLVNTPGSWSYVYTPFLHADWHGATPTDFIFPFFLFIVGSAMYFSNRASQGVSYSVRSVKILRRTLLLFVIGLLLNAYPFTGDLDHLRILGVLQRIALAYGLAAFIIWLPGVYRLLVSAFLLLGYYLLLNLVPEPYTVADNLVRQLDLLVLGADHLWQGKGMAFDPEGLLSTLPAVVNVIFGFEAARILVASDNKHRAQIVLALMSVAAIVAALLWHPVFPINKSLWSSPFVLLSSGAAIAVLLLLVQLERLSVVRPVFNAFTMLGKNPLFIYILSIVWAKSYYLFSINGGSSYQYFFEFLARWMSNYNASLVFALIHVAVLWCIAWWLDRKNIVIAL